MRFFLFERGWGGGKRVFGKGGGFGKGFFLGKGG